MGRSQTILFATIIGQVIDKRTAIHLHSEELKCRTMGVTLTIEAMVNLIEYFETANDLIPKHEIKCLYNVSTLRLTNENDVREADMSELKRTVGDLHAKIAAIGPPSKYKVYQDKNTPVRRPQHPPNEHNRQHYGKPYSQQRGWEQSQENYPYHRGDKTLSPIKRRPPYVAPNGQRPQSQHNDQKTRYPYPSRNRPNSPGPVRRRQSDSRDRARSESPYSAERPRTNRPLIGKNSKFKPNFSSTPRSQSRENRAKSPYRNQSGQKNYRNPN